jgi:uncharacterized protein
VSAGEILRRGYDAFNRGDVDAMTEIMEPDFVWHEAPEVPGPKATIGREEFAGYVRSFDRLWEEFSFEVTELEEGSGEMMLARVRGQGRGREAGTEIDLEIFHVWRLRGERVARMDAFLDERSAREAAGLE